MNDPRLQSIVSSQPYPLIFATISGAHLYGFASPDSDYDLRGVHVLPVKEIVGLYPGNETIEVSKAEQGLELDLVTHDIRKFIGLMLRKNGYVLEQLYSPLVVHTAPEHEELKELGKGCITRFHAYHYLGFAETQWNLFEKESPRRVKPLLYVFRVLLTGIHLMREGVIEANLRLLNDSFKLPYVEQLILQKTSGPEKGTLESREYDFYAAEYVRLRTELERAQEQCSLPETPSAASGLNDLLIRLRTDR